MEVEGWRLQVGGSKVDRQAGKQAGGQAGRLAGWLQNGSWRLDPLSSWQVDQLARALEVGYIVIKRISKTHIHSGLGGLEGPVPTAVITSVADSASDRAPFLQKRRIVS